MYKIKYQKITFISNRKKILKNLQQIFFFYGIGNSSSDFDFLLKKISKTYQIIIPELPGHNYEDFYDNLSLTNFSRLISLFIKKNKMSNLIFFSHSVGGIIPILLAKNLKQKVFFKKFINYEGNLTNYDTNTTTKKTSNYKMNEFKLKFKKLIEICEQSDLKSLKLWSKSLKKTNPKAFHKISKEAVFYSEGKKLLEFFRVFFKKKIYVYGSKTELSLPEFCFGSIRHKIDKTGHFAFFDNKKNFTKIFFKLLNTY
tara:strand:- start:509 stop:1276 length:768 start_codon:yes stop_codon:yes gene_type:complete